MKFLTTVMASRDQPSVDVGNEGHYANHETLGKVRMGRFQITGATSKLRQFGRLIPSMFRGASDPVANADLRATTIVEDTVKSVLTGRASPLERPPHVSRFPIVSTMCGHWSRLFVLSQASHQTPSVPVP